MMGWHAGYIGGAGGLLGLFFLLLLAVALGLILWGLLRTREHGQLPTSDTAYQALRERFARGEISQADFEAAKKTLGY